MYVILCTIQFEAHEPFSVKGEYAESLLVVSSGQFLGRYGDVIRVHHPGDVVGMQDFFWRGKASATVQAAVVSTAWVAGIKDVFELASCAEYECVQARLDAAFRLSPVTRRVR